VTERDGRTTGGDGSLVPPAGWVEPRTDRDAGPGAGYLLLVTALAALLRLWQLDGMSLWIDEIMTWNLVAPGRGLDFVDQMLAAYQGPLYPAVVWPLLRWEESAVMLRLPAAVAGIVAVPLLGVFAARLWGRRTGRLAALLLALSPFAVWYAQEGRGYSFAILWAIAAGLVMLAALERGPSAGRMAALLLVGFLGVTSNNSFLFLLLAFGVTVLCVARPRRWREWGGWAVGLGGGVVLALPWLLAAAGIWELGRVLPGAETGDALRGETTFTYWALPFAAHAFVYGFSLGPSLTELHGADRLAIVRQHAPLLTVGALLAGAAFLASLRRLGRRRWILLLWIAVPVALVVLLAVRNIKPFNVRYLAVAFPWVLLLIAAGIAGTGRRVRLLLGGGLCVLCLIALAGHFLDERHAKEDIRGAVAAIAASARPERPLLVPASAPVVRHYWQGQSPVLGMYGEPVIGDPSLADAVLRRHLAGLDEAWIVWARSWDRDPHHLLPAALRRQGSLERIHTGPQVAVDLWRRSPGEATP
jgi:hypothetical protein